MLVFRLLFVFAVASGAQPPPAADNGTRFTVGTVLFSQSDLLRECWSPDSVALLTSRMLLKNLMPHVDTLKVDDDKFVLDIIDYFRLLLEVIRQSTSGKTKHFMLLALTDTLGGYMKHLILPISKYSFYAGNVQYASIIKLYQLYDELKNYLRTNGNSWARPWKRAGKHVVAKPISLQSPAPSTDPCKGLIYYKHHKPPDARGGEGREEKNTNPGGHGCSMEVPLPFFDSKSHPSAIAVPFKTFGLRNLESRVSSYILVKFYVAVSKCMASRNTNERDVQRFNSNVLGFIMAKVMPHLCDDKFYAAFGGVLRILETIKQVGNKNAQPMGSFNIIPEIEEREPFPDMEDTDELGGASGGGTGGSTNTNSDKSKNNLILLAALATIVIWFCLGAAFVCCRIRVSKMKKDDKLKALEEKEPVQQPQSKAKSKSRSTEPCPVLMDIKKGGPTTCNDGSCPVFRQISHSSIDDGGAYALETVNKSKSTSSKSSKTTSPTTEGESDLNTKTSPEIRVVNNPQYYPSTYACHTSMTGKVKMDSSTEDYTSRDDTKRPYVFGYDFQTTSDESSPRETSDGENEMGGNMSK